MTPPVGDNHVIVLCSFVSMTVNNVLCKKCDTITYIVYSIIDTLQVNSSCRVDEGQRLGDEYMYIYGDDDIHIHTSAMAYRMATCHGDTNEAHDYQCSALYA